MLAAALLLQTSGIVAPLYLGDEVPETRAVQAIQLVHRDAPDAPDSVRISKQEAADLAAGLVQQLREGADFAALARQHSMHPSSKVGGVLGCFWPGMLRGEADEFLYAAEVGAVSDPIESDRGYWIFRRIEAEAGCLQIFVEGTDDAARAKIADLRARLDAGADFGELAREACEDPVSAPRGGQLAVFLRSPRDALLKAAAFEAGVGEVAGPIESPLGLHLVKRVPPEEIDPTLYDNVIARVRAISILTTEDRPQAQAEALINELHGQLLDGADMAELAREWDEDEGGAERAGDLGWVLRGATQTRNFMNWAFLKPQGEILGPFADRDRWVILRRER